MGQIFIAESRWDWSVLEALRNELSDAERDRFLDATPISALELIDFHQQLEDVSSIANLQNLAPEKASAPQLTGEEKPAVESAPEPGGDLEIKERDPKEHRGQRNTGERPERGEDKVNKPGSNAPNPNCGDDAPSKA